MNIGEWQHGHKYQIGMNGDLMIRRERGVKLGDMRVFRSNTTTMYDTGVLYYAERKFRSIIPFRAPKVWWRKINEQTISI